MQFIYFGILFLDFFMLMQGKNDDFNSELDGNNHLQNSKNLGPNFYKDDTVVSLYLQYKHIETISDAAFDNLFQLQLLNLEENNLVTRSLSFASLPNLTSLLCDNSYRSNAEDGNGFTIDLVAPKLQVLSLEYNSIKKLIVKNFPETVRTMNLKNNLLTEVPDLKNASSLGLFFLQNNTIEGLKEGDFKTMPNLKMIDISKNKIREIGANTFSDLDNLKMIFLGENFLQSIHYSAFHLQTSLVSLYLEHNNIEFFDGQILENNQKLNFVDLSANLLKEFSVLKNPTGLKMLRLNDNYIRILSAENFTSMVNLRRLSLSNNSISEILPGTFDGLKNLEVLSLNSNQLKNLPNQWSLCLKSLKLLRLHDNQFEKIENLSIDLDSSLPNAILFYTVKNDGTFRCNETDVNGFRLCEPVKLIEQGNFQSK